MDTGARKAIETAQIGGKRAKKVTYRPLRGRHSALPEVKCRPAGKSSPPRPGICEIVVNPPCVGHVTHSPQEWTKRYQSAPVPHSHTATNHTATQSQHTVTAQP